MTMAEGPWHSIATIIVLIATVLRLEHRFSGGRTLSGKAALFARKPYGCSARTAGEITAFFPPFHRKATATCFPLRATWCTAQVGRKTTATRYSTAVAWA